MYTVLSSTFTAESDFSPETEKNMTVWTIGEWYDIMKTIPEAGVVFFQIPHEYTFWLNRDQALCDSCVTFHVLCYIRKEGNPNFEKI